MLENIIRFYKKELSADKLVFKEIKHVWWLFLLSGVFVFFGSTAVVIFKWPKVFDVIFVMVFTVTFLILNSGAKNTLMKKYGILPDGFMWFNIAYDEMRVKKMKDYLQDNQLLSEAKVKLMIELLYKKAQKTKPTGLIGVGVFLSFFIPLWSQFIALLFKSSTTLDEAVSITGMITIGLVVVFITLYMLQIMMIEFIDRERQAMRELAGMLEQILLML